MTQEEKDLLLKDLCARLPYGVIVQWNKCDNPWVPDGKFKAEDFDHLASPFYEIKPYLRPMSSMTEEEKIESLEFAWEDDYGRLASYNENISKYIDWLNKHHFDYRNLIEKGLALEVTEENNPYKE